MLSWISGSSITDNNVPLTRSCSLCGYLYKMKKEKKLLVPQWSKRWFSIEGKNLRWYHNSYDDEPSGSIDLKKVNYITRFEYNQTFSFIVGYPDRNLLIRADSLIEMEKWIRALQLQADVARGGNGMNVLTSNTSNSTSPEGKNKALKKKSNSLEAELDRSLRQLNELERKLLVKADDIDINVQTDYYNYLPKRNEDYKQPPKIKNDYNEKSLDRYIDKINENDFQRQISYATLDKSLDKSIRRSNKQYDESIEKQVDTTTNSIRKSSRQSEEPLERLYDSLTIRPLSRQSSNSSSKQLDNRLSNNELPYKLDRQSSKQYDDTQSNKSNGRSSNRPDDITDSQFISRTTNRSNSKQLNDLQAEEYDYSDYKENKRQLSIGKPLVNPLDRQVDKRNSKSTNRQMNRDDSKDDEQVTNKPASKTSEKAKSLHKSDSNESLEEIVDRPIRRPPRRIPSNGNTNNLTNIQPTNQTNSQSISQPNGQSNTYNKPRTFSSSSNDSISNLSNDQSINRYSNNDDEFDIQEVDLNVTKTNRRSMKLPPVAVNQNSNSRRNY